MSSRPVRLSAAPTRARRAPEGPQEAVDACLERVRADAFERGRRAGAREAAQAAAAALGRAAQAFDAARADLAEEAVADVVWLATEIARQLLRSEIDAGRYDLEGMVRGILADAGVGRSPCAVHLHPEDARALAEVEFRAGTSIEEDPGVRRGDVHVTTPQGLAVRELEDAVDAIREALHPRR